MRCITTAQDGKRSRFEGEEDDDVDDDDDARVCGEDSGGKGDGSHTLSSLLNRLRNRSTSSRSTRETEKGSKCSSAHLFHPI